jgi:hypothetical protein
MARFKKKNNSLEGGVLISFANFMQNKYIKFLIIALAVVIVVPQIALAAWWNPFSWGIWNSIFHFQQTKTQQQEERVEKNISENDFKNATLSFVNPYDNSKTDTFTLSNGKVLLNAGGPPVAYDVAKTAIGDLNGDGVNDGAIAVYESFGANIVTPVVFAVTEKNGKLSQIDAAALGGTDSEIKSVAINDEVLAVSLLTVSQHDQQTLPHYQWKATEAKTLQYKLTNGKLVLQPTDQTAGWKTYTNAQYGFEIKYPETLYLESRDIAPALVYFKEVKYKNEEITSRPSITLTLIKTKLTPENWVTKSGENLIQLEDRKTPITDITIGTITGVKFYSAPATGSTDHSIIRINNDYLVDISLNHSPNGEISSDIYQQMLSTFKFTK